MNQEIKRMRESVEAMNEALDNLTKVCKRGTGDGVETRLCSLETSVRSMAKAVESLSGKVAKNG